MVYGEIKNERARNGKGDVVKEVSDSCRKYGIKFCVYLSPWDRNHKDYSAPKYNDIYCEQLTELLTNYGDVYCVWFDGACGAYMDGKEKQVYDWDRYFSLIRELAPMACISNCGPDIRWVGNEGGFARESEWNVVPQFAYDIQTIEANSQQANDSSFAKLEFYYTSVGRNSLFLLNLTPDKRGLIHENDVNMMKNWVSIFPIQKKDLLEIVSLRALKADGENIIENVKEYAYNTQTYDTVSYYTPE